MTRGAKYVVRTEVLYTRPPKDKSGRRGGGGGGGGKGSKDEDERILISEVRSCARVVGF